MSDTSQYTSTELQSAPQHTPSVRAVNFRPHARRARIRQCKEISGAVHAEPGNPRTRPGHGEFHRRSAVHSDEVMLWANLMQRVARLFSSVSIAWLDAAVFGTEPSCPTNTSDGECTCQIGERSNDSSCTICTCKDAGETGVPHCLAPVDGSWSSWSSYSSCSVSCGLGLQNRTRTCNNPYPRYNGAVCDGSPTETVLCDTQVTCPDCVDDNADCPARALSGECVRNSGYMLVNCRLSCDVCTANATDMCSTPPCHVTCTNSSDYLRYDCTCSGGWEGNLCNETVELTLEDIDECASSPCTNGGVCLDRLSGYLCQCGPNCDTGVTRDRDSSVSVNVIQHQGQG
ncbi:hypothetical protein Bbelb_352100 [Branchiostoma belcheri]|nr:hypothetical protein Bbelb_352100 [Branchiostoma belcheri]